MLYSLIGTRSSALFYLVALHILALIGRHPWLLFVITYYRTLTPCSPFICFYQRHDNATQQPSI